MDRAVNRQRELIDILKTSKEEGRPLRILLHACCAPCASSCLEVLDRYTSVTVFFYNPNITDRAEYDYRLEELKKLITMIPFENKVGLIEGIYEPEVFLEKAKGLEQEPERGRRCHMCYRQRLEKTAYVATAEGFDRFATTLTLSPLKPADVINATGAAISPQLYLPSDFKKNNGYLRSIELSREYGLYRQNYCGCVYSRTQA